MQSAYALLAQSMGHPAFSDADAGNELWGELLEGDHPVARVVDHGKDRYIAQPSYNKLWHVSPNLGSVGCVSSSDGCV
jgi:hypothetical protein